MQKKNWRSAKQSRMEYVSTSWNGAGATKNGCVVLLRTWEPSLLLSFTKTLIISLLFVISEVRNLWLPVLLQNRDHMWDRWDDPPLKLACGEGRVPVLITFPSQTSCCGVIHHDYKSARCWKPTAPPAACERHRKKSPVPSVPPGRVLRSHTTGDSGGQHSRQQTVFFNGGQTHFEERDKVIFFLFRWKYM